MMRIRSHLLASSVVVAASSTMLAGPAMASTVRDARSPDAIDAAQQAAQQDMRSPDAAEAAAVTRRQTFVAVTPPRGVAEPASGFDWGSAAIGAGGALGLAAVATGGGLALRRRHSAEPSRGVAH